MKQWPSCIIVITLQTCIAFGLDVIHSVPIEEIDLSRSKRSIQDTLPSRLSFGFHAHGHDVTLHLKKNDDINVNAPMCTMLDGILQCVTGKEQDFAVYYDLDLYATVSVSITKYANGSFSRSLEGDYTDGKHSYFIKPKSANFRAHSGRNIHYVIKRALPKQESDAMSQRSKSPSKPNPERTTYGVELLMLIDHGIYETFLNKSNNTEEALKKIRYYFAYIVNGIDVRFSNINASDFDIHVRHIGYYVAQDQFIGVTRLDDPRYLDANATMMKLENFIQGIKGLPSFDHAMMFTNSHVGDSESNALGATYIAGICGNKSLSLIVDHGMYSSSGTGAHELAHNIGVKYHDGVGKARRCPSQLNYIMAPTVAILNATTKQYSYQFSNCSVNQMRKNLFRVSINNSCLVQTSLNNAKNIKKFLKDPPGLRENVHEQCRKLYGEESFMCPPKDTSEVCYKMLCYSTERKSCVAVSEQRAAMGTPCGDKKWCVLSTCVPNKKAPAVPDDCPWPDLPPEMVKPNCSAADSLLCQNPEYRRRCCTSCNQNFTTAESQTQSTCIDYVINNLVCPDVVRKHGLLKCESDSLLYTYCCKSCTGACPATPASTNTDTCSNNQYVRFNGLDCDSFLCKYGYGMCSRSELKQYCCASCSSS